MAGKLNLIIYRSLEAVEKQAILTAFNVWQDYLGLPEKLRMLDVNWAKSKNRLVRCKGFG